MNVTGLLRYCDRPCPYAMIVFHWLLMLLGRYTDCINFVFIASDFDAC